jgi:hypothetical protein
MIIFQIYVADFAGFPVDTKRQTTVAGDIKASVYFTNPVRKLPISIESEAFNETVRVKHPPEFAVDEKPDPVNLGMPFGTYHAECTSIKDGRLYRRSLMLRNAVLPAGQYDDLRKFFRSIKSFEDSPVVLIRK